jgi:methylenetetrahydrofolate reductase (NADPH)
VLQVTPSRKEPFLGAYNANEGYPDGHADNSVDEDTEIDRLKAKVDSGADFVITQLFYDVDHFLSWYKKIRQKGSLLTFYIYSSFLEWPPGITVPVIPGIMPIQTYSSFARVTKLCGARVPESLASTLANLSVSQG